METSQINLILSSVLLTLLCAIISSTIPNQNTDRLNYQKFQLQKNLNDLNN